jgi:hypothetical protein
MPTNRASMKVGQRQSALTAYLITNGIVVPPQGQVNQLTARFSSFANTMQTRMNSSNGTGSSLGGTLEAQVDRALSQVLRQPGGGTATAVATRPGDTSIISLVGGAGGVQPSMSPYQASLLREGRITQADSLSVLDSLQPLSPFTDPGDTASLQAVVRAEINGLLEEFSYTCLRPRQQRARVFLGALLGWNYDSYDVTSPLAQNAAGANAPFGDIQALVTLLNLGGPIIPTVTIEDQLASQQVLGTDGALFDTQWNTFWGNGLQGYWTQQWGPGNSWSLWEPNLTAKNPGGLTSLLPKSVDGGDVSLIPLGPQSPQTALQAPWRIGIINNPTAVPGFSYAEKIIQADLLLPVIAQDASRVADSIAAIGFSTGEQETQFAWFWSAVDTDLLGGPPIAVPANLGWSVLNGLSPGGGAPPNPNMYPIPVYMTVADILDWARNLAGPTSSDQLRQAGALGLNLICDQADELFWLALAMLDPTASAQIAALADTEVQLEISSLATDLNTLANLAY